MADLVRVESIDALKRFRAALCKFAEITGAGLDEAEFEIQRTGFWVKQDQQVHWKRQAAHRTELVTRAKLALKQKESQKTALGGRYSCVDEMKALAAAERALEEARRKQESVRRWSRVLDEESFAFQAHTQPLRLMLQADIPTALAQLDQMIVALEAYATPGPPQEQVSTAVLSGGEAIEDHLPTMARAPANASGMAVDVYHKLRARTPSQAIRDATPVSEASADGAKMNIAGLDMPSDLSATLAGRGLPQTRCGGDEKVVLARAVLQARQVYLERAASAGQPDSGWYVGFADETEAAGHEAMRVADLVAARPDWAAVLALPAGCVVTFDGSAIQAVYDPRGHLVWCVR
jgi:hypothetical protein